ncbi:hypothetical protein [Desulfosporosinus sp. BICA1-9]|uniref:hypothetical protein n=1 Tax=Desulfosporosinus sp. BICA1-9 TaxID=1531958 RepID=UPI0025C49D68|nr:hypothetical protein [Desulfosporosinus sp. BICA1-9]
MMMRKMILFLVFLLAAVSMITGCNSEKEAATNDKKEILFQIKNTTGADWVLTTSTYGSDKYRGDQDSVNENDDSVDAVDVSDFTIKAGASNRYQVSGVSMEKAIQSGSLKETSKTTYEYKVQCVAAGVVPGDPKEWSIEKPFSSVQDIIISGTYGESMVIEWDGTSFKQAK